MNRSEKIAFVESFSDSIKRHECMIVVRHNGIDSVSMTDLRRSAHAENVSFRVVKNSLFKLSVKDLSSEISSHIKGPVGVFLSEDPVAASKVVSAFSKKKKESFVPLLGLFSGNVVGVEEVHAFAALPSFDEMRSVFLRTLLDSLTSLVRTLNATQTAFVQTIFLHNQNNT
jgi:large subunit ribosomal protein L10